MISAPHEHTQSMSLKHKLEIRTGDFSISQPADRGPNPARHFKDAFGVATRCLRGLMLVTIAPALFNLPQPGFAQERALTEVTLATEVSGTKPAAATPVSSGTGTITGTVLDVNGDLVSGATVVLNGTSAADRREVLADDSAAFKFDSVKPGTPYEISVHVKGFSSWRSSSIVLEPSQFLILDPIHLKMEGEATSITVHGSTEEIAVEQLHLEEQQRVLGIIPNFYAVYDSANAVPLTTRLKFRLAMRVARDPVTIMGIGFMSGIDQAIDRPDYVQGAKGYGQRLGAGAAGGFSDILLGGAVLPSLLHQDPRYFYQGTGGTSSRLKHALASPFVCRGDNGHRQVNFSSIGGDLGATALSMSYYPDSNRGTRDVFVTLGINQAERAMAAIAQEFIIPRFTPSLRKSK